MAGKASATGFGFQYFGDHPFGGADWAEEVSWKILTSEDRDADSKLPVVPSVPLRKFINALKPQFQEIKDKFDQFTTLWDANRVPLKQLKNLGYNFNIILETLKETTDQEILTNVSGTIDLSDLVVAPPAQIVPGSFVIKVVVASTGRTYRVVDDGEGNLFERVALPAGGTIDYVTGSLTGVTSQLENGSSVLVSYLASSKDEQLQRSEVLNAIQFFLNKGVDRGYAIAAAFSGLMIVVTPLWAETCAPSSELQENGPTVFTPRFDFVPADKIPLDSSYTGFFDIWPKRLEWEDPCRSNWLDVYVFAGSGSASDTIYDNYSATAEAVISDLERVRPIHVRFREVRFGGTPFVAGGWTIPVVAENNFAAGGWTISVVGDRVASAGGWSIPVVATPVS